MTTTRPVAPAAPAPPSVAREYAEAILWRGRVPMEPSAFVPDWADRPRKWKHYAGADSYPLPDADSAGSVAQGIFGTRSRAHADRGFTLPDLGGMLRDTYGLVGRRLAIQANTDLTALPRYPVANWNRGAASGGGLYPVTVYWVAGPGAPVLPGVYHYAPHQHALRPLLSGDVTGVVREALGREALGREALGREALGGSEHDQFLVLGVKYWQNAFKYNSFCFHAVSMDVGAAAQALRTWARSAGLTAEPRWFFDESRLARLLGVDDDSEGIFAVVPIRWSGGPGDADRSRDARAGAPGARVGHRDTERSRRVLDFEAVERMHRATRQDAPGAPAAAELAAAAVHRPVGEPHVVLPAVTALSAPLRQALRRRHSSFGRFDARTPLTAETLATVLAAAAAEGGDGLVGHYVFVNHVQGLEPGSYRHADGRLWLLDPTPPGEFLQRSYFLANYNLERAAAVVVPTMRTGAVIDAVGDRGFRLVNATIGGVAQNAYLACSALGIGCGVALGFDNVSYVEQLGLVDGEVPLLLMLLGHERPGSAEFRYEIA